MKTLIEVILNNLLYPLLIVLGMWVLFLFNIAYGWNLETLGLKPHYVDGWWGLLFMPLLHENAEHIFSNTIPVFVAGGFIFHYFKNWAWLVFSSIWLGTGIILWFIGQAGTNHIGASGLVYGLVFFLLISGFIRQNRELSAVALLMVFLYGGLLWGLFPEYVRLTRENISWEGHLAGAIMGILMSLFLIKKGPQKTIDLIEEEDEDLEEFPYWLEENAEESMKENPDQVNEEKPRTIIHYRYVPKNANPWEKDDPN